MKKTVELAKFVAANARRSDWPPNISIILIAQLEDEPHTLSELLQHSMDPPIIAQAMKMGIMEEEFGREVGWELWQRLRRKINRLAFTNAVVAKRAINLALAELETEDERERMLRRLMGKEITISASWEDDGKDEVTEKVEIKVESIKEDEQNESAMCRGFYDGQNSSKGQADDLQEARRMPTGILPGSPRSVSQRRSEELLNNVAGRDG